MSKRGQEATTNESSSMAKHLPTIAEKARPINLVMRSPRSEKDSSQKLEYSSIQGMSTNEKKWTLPLETDGERSNSKNKVMIKHLLTPIAQGSLCSVRIRNQSIKT